MNRLQALLGGMCMVVLALGPGLAYAQGVPENTPETCSDRVDNDGDGYVDCYDPDCRYLAFCQQGAQPPPPPPQQYQPPPPGYEQQPPPGYQPPPPGYPPPPNYYPPPPQYGAPVYVPPPRGPSRGIGDIIVGFIFFPLGAILLGTSAILWNDADFGANVSSTRYANAWGGVVMDLFGSAFFVIGAILIPVGFVKEGAYNRWKANHHAGLFDLGHGVSMTPSMSSTSTGGVTSNTLGATFHF